VVRVQQARCWITKQSARARAWQSFVQHVGRPVSCSVQCVIEEFARLHGGSAPNICTATPRSFLRRHTRRVGRCVHGDSKRTPSPTSTALRVQAPSLQMPNSFKRKLCECMTVVVRKASARGRDEGGWATARGNGITAVSRTYVGTHVDGKHVWPAMPQMLA
jgi:hypothetical protein